jgi:hypothetical protein
VEALPVAGDDPELAKPLRIEERELEAGGRDRIDRRTLVVVGRFAWIERVVGRFNRWFGSTAPASEGAGGLWVGWPSKPPSDIEQSGHVSEQDAERTEKPGSSTPP